MRRLDPAREFSDRTIARFCSSTGEEGVPGGEVHELKTLLTSGSSSPQLRDVSGSCTGLSRTGRCQPDDAVTHIAARSSPLAKGENTRQPMRGLMNWLVSGVP
jgi:hypothetical protein